MKKIVCVLLFVALLASLSSCALFKDNSEIRIGVMNGPTGMGMAKLVADAAADENSNYSFEAYASPDLAIPELTKGGIDMLCLPTNTAATLSKKLDISVIAINCLGSLYLVTDENTSVNSISDLEGKTIYCSVPNSTTVPIINYLLDEFNVNANVECVSDHDALVAKVVKNDVSIAVLPEPKASAALAQNNKYSVDLNLSTEWSKVSEEPLTMGCIVVRNEYLKENRRTVEAFLKEYEASINYIGNKDNIDTAVSMITEAGIIPKAPIAKKALNNLYGSIVYLDGKDMKSALIAFYNAIGQELPDERFYYDK